MHAWDVIVCVNDFGAQPKNSVTTLILHIFVQKDILQLKNVSMVIPFIH